MHALGYLKKGELLLPSPGYDNVASFDALHWHGVGYFAFLHEREGICFRTHLHVHLPSPILTFQELFLQLFPQLPLLGLLLLLHFLYLGPFSPPLMISILMYFVMITAEVAVKICQLHGQNTVDHIDLVD